MTETITFPIEGMTCTSCVSRITGALRKLDGVRSARVDLATDTATVTFEPALVSTAAMAAAVCRAGYEAQMDEMRKVDLPAATEAGLPSTRALVAVVGVLGLGIVLALGVPLGSLVPLVAMAGCLGMHLLMGHGEHRH